MPVATSYDGERFARVSTGTPRQTDPRGEATSYRDQRSKWDSFLVRGAEEREERSNNHSVRRIRSEAGPAIRRDPAITADVAGPKGEAQPSCGVFGRREATALLVRSMTIPRLRRDVVGRVESGSFRRRSPSPSGIPPSSVSGSRGIVPYVLTSAAR